ncbi:MAG: integration host factor subunit alpha [Proteobacteria bacterium]|jgi:integration host factor subunit alpha|nr:integration host factor subunit alpha [Pseudomonadota bacterium]
MTKADLIDAIYEKVGLSKKESTQIVELIFELMRKSLEKSQKVKISGFGNFNIRGKNIRRGRNPQTGDEIKISARSVLTFKASPVLKKVLNG